MSIVFQDGSITVNPAPNDSPKEGYFSAPIQIDGDQNSLKVIDQILDTFSFSPGLVNSSDSIIEAINKLAASVDTVYSVIHVSDDRILTGLQRSFIIDEGTNGKNFTLPSSSDSYVIPGASYRFFIANGGPYSNTIAVQSGDYLNTTVDGTYTLVSDLSQWKFVCATSDGSGWFIGS